MQRRVDDERARQVPTRFQEALALVVLSQAVAHPPGRFWPGDLGGDDKVTGTGIQSLQRLQAVVVKSGCQHHGYRSASGGREVDEAPTEPGQCVKGGPECVAPLCDDVCFVYREEIQPALGSGCLEWSR